MTDPETIKTARQRLKDIYLQRPSLAASTGRTNIRLEDGLKCEITQDGRAMTCDQPRTNGGDDTGPDPGFFGRGALGACLAQGYAIMFAERGIGFQSIDIQVEADSDGLGMFDLNPNIPPGYERVRCLVNIVSDADEGKINAAIEDANRTSPWLYDFTQPLDVSHSLTVKKPD